MLLLQEDRKSRVEDVFIYDASPGVLKGWLRSTRRFPHVVLHVCADREMGSQRLTTHGRRRLPDSDRGSQKCYMNWVMWKPPIYHSMPIMAQLLKLRGKECAWYQFACESVHQRSAVTISGSWLESLPEDNFGTKILLSAMTNRKKNRIMPIPW